MAPFRLAILIAVLDQSRGSCSLYQRPVSGLLAEGTVYNYEIAYCGEFHY